MNTWEFPSNRGKPFNAIQLAQTHCYYQAKALSFVLDRYFPHTCDSQDAKAVWKWLNEPLSPVKGSSRVLEEQGIVPRRFVRCSFSDFPKEEQGHSFVLFQIDFNLYQIVQAFQARFPLRYNQRTLNQDEAEVLFDILARTGLDTQTRDVLSWLLQLEDDVLPQDDTYLKWTKEFEMASDSPFVFVTDPPLPLPPGSHESSNESIELARLGRFICFVFGVAVFLLVFGVHIVSRIAYFV